MMLQSQEIGECRPNILDRLLDDILGDFEHHG